jgi:hypothetical protein
MRTHLEKDSRIDGHKKQTESQRYIMLCHIAFYGFCNFLLVDDLMKVFDNVF